MHLITGYKSMDMRVMMYYPEVIAVNNTWPPFL